VTDALVALCEANGPNEIPQVQKGALVQGRPDHFLMVFRTKESFAGGWCHAAPGLMLKSPMPKTADYILTPQTIPWISPLLMDESTKYTYLLLEMCLFPIYSYMPIYSIYHISG
jgi:hypothetical protein